MTHKPKEATKVGSEKGEDMSKDIIDQPVSEGKCQARHDALAQNLDRQFSALGAKLDEINSKLFIGNGTPALMIRVDRLEQSSKLVGWALAIVLTVLLSMGTTAIVKAVSSHSGQADQVAKPSQHGDNGSSPGG